MRPPSTGCSTTVLGSEGGTRSEVRQAITDLERQRSQLKLVGRTFIVDVVLQTPARFSDAVRDALEAELPTLAPAASSFQVSLS